MQALLLALAAQGMAGQPPREEGMHCQTVLCPGRGTPKEGTPGSPVPGTPTQLAKLSAHAGCHVKGGRWSTPALPALPVVPQGLEGSLSHLDRAEAACEAPLSTPAQVTGAAGAAWSHRRTMSLLFLPCLVQPLCWHCLPGLAGTSRARRNSCFWLGTAT